MDLWTFVLVPLLVLPIVLLFRFVGCGSLLPDPGHAPDVDEPMRMPPPARPAPYSETILFDPSRVIAYWRLVDEPATAAGPAKDETGKTNATYVTVANLPQEPATTERGPSQSAQGDFQGPEKSLIQANPMDRMKHCRIFRGGYVVVPFVPGLFTDEFTIEAWIEVQWGATTIGFEHTLFSAGGHESDESFFPPHHGFSVFADGSNRWQVRLAPDHDQRLGLFPSPPAIPSNRTHVAVSVQNEGSKKRVRLFVDGVVRGSELVDKYHRPPDSQNWPLYIGVENTASPAQAAVLHRPILCKVQEVALYNTALDLGVINGHVSINP